MSLYADYIKERTTDEILETPDGFATYRYVEEGKTVYIIDLYTVPAARKSGCATLLGNAVAAIAKDRGCTSMIGTVVPSAKGSTISLKVLIAYGMHLETSGQDLIVMRKEI